MEAEKSNFEKNETPPFGNSWNKFYAIVLGELVVIIFFFYFFTKVFE